MLEHVVHISDLSQERDGPTAIALAAVREFRKRGVRVTYLCGDDGVNPELTSLGVRVIALRGSEIGKAHPAAAMINGLYNQAAAAALKRLISEVDGDGVVYHLHNWSKILSPSIFPLLRRISSRVLMSAHDYFMACPNGGFFNFQTKEACTLAPLSGACLSTNCDRRSYTQKVWRIARDVERRAFIDLSKTEATILAVHDGMVEHLTRGGVASGAIEVLRNPVTPWSDERISAEGNRKFLFVGRLDHDKGADLLARAAALAGAPLQFIGDGPLRDALATNYPDVELSGWQSRAQIAEHAKTARAVVVPTGSRETFGLVAFEALTSGIPVVISKFAATANEIPANGVGLVCDPYDKESLAQSLKSLKDDDQLIAKMSARAWEARNALTLSPQEWGNRLMSHYNAKANDASHSTLKRASNAG